MSEPTSDDKARRVGDEEVNSAAATLSTLRPGTPETQYSRYVFDLQDARTQIEALKEENAELELSHQHITEQANLDSDTIGELLDKNAELIKGYETCCCGEMMEGHSVTSGHNPVSMTDHARFLNEAEITQLQTKNAEQLEALRAQVAYETALEAGILPQDKIIALNWWAHSLRWTVLGEAEDTLSSLDPTTMQALVNRALGDGDAEAKEPTGEPDWPEGSEA